MEEDGHKRVLFPDQTHVGYTHHIVLAGGDHSSSRGFLKSSNFDAAMFEDAESGTPSEISETSPMHDESDFLKSLRGRATGAETPVFGSGRQMSSDEVPQNPDTLNVGRDRTPDVKSQTDTLSDEEFMAMLQGSSGPKKQTSAPDPDAEFLAMLNAAKAGGTGL